MYYYGVDLGLVCIFIVSSVSFSCFILRVLWDGKMILGRF